MRPLFEITSDIFDVVQILDRMDDGTDLEACLDLMQWIEQLDKEQQAKVDAYCWVIKRLESEAQNARDIAKEFAEKAKMRESRIETMKESLKTHMTVIGQTKLAGKDFTISLQNNGGNLPVIIDDEYEIPDECMVVTKAPDRTAIRLKIERGENVPGAHLGERGRSIRIR